MHRTIACFLGGFVVGGTAVSLVLWPEREKDTGETPDASTNVAPGRRRMVLPTGDEALKIGLKSCESLVPYKDGDLELEALVSQPPGDPKGRKLPGVLFIPDITGIDRTAHERAMQIASDCNVAVFCCDIYGKAVRPHDPIAGAKEAEKYLLDRTLLRDRLSAGLRAFAATEGVDATQIAAVGDGFGGTAAMELACTRAALKGVVSVHGNLDDLSPDDASRIAGKVLFFLQNEGDEATFAALDEAKVDWRAERNGNAKLGRNESVVHKAELAKREAASMRSFLNEIFDWSSSGSSRLGRRRVVLPDPEPASPAPPPASASPSQ